MATLVGTDFKPADLVLVEANPSQERKSWHMKATAWSEPLSQEAFIARAEFLKTTPILSAKGSRCWAFHPEGQPDRIVSICEIIENRILIRDATGVREGKGFGIAGVLTNPEYRGKGVASLMMTKMQGIMDRESDCSALFSGIGRKFYSRLGWPVFPSFEVALHLSQQPIPNPKGLEDITEKEIEKLSNQDVENIVKQWHSLGADSKTHITFLPDYARLQLHLARSNYTAKSLLGKEITVTGARLLDGSDWICWEHNFRKHALVILRIVAMDIESISNLLHAALHEASKWNFTEVIAWNPNEAVLKGADTVKESVETSLEVEFRERMDNQIPSLRLKDGNEAEDVVWENLEFYTWC